MMLIIMELCISILCLCLSYKLLQTWKFDFVHSGTSTQIHKTEATKEVEDEMPKM